MNDILLCVVITLTTLPFEPEHISAYTLLFGKWQIRQKSLSLEKEPLYYTL